jgi:2-polyprenyl-6-methoxyphenol hydroxylase-like FAD-dependent oxidoreductase
MVARRRGLSEAADVLVVGAGPTGLATALQAHEHGATVRIVDRRPTAFRRSRAMVMHPRMLEGLRPLGVTGRLLERADRAPRAELHVGRRRVAVQLADVPLRDTAFPHLTLVRQMDVEEVLGDALEQRGVEVERGVELVDASADDGAVRATLAGEGGTEDTRYRFVAGCDGPDSTVRTLAGIPWRGRPYREEVVLADVELDGDLQSDVLHVVAARPGLVFVFALGEGATWRIMATRRVGGSDVPFGQPGRDIPHSDVQAILDAAGLDVTVRELTWSAQVRLQHALAGSFRRGPLFLAGDAAHAHSPAAAQGMNTGILDALNLGWKLAFSAEDPDHPELLESYEQERRPVARQVIALTHLVFFAEASTHPLPALLRGALVPPAAPLLSSLVRRRALMAQVVRLLSQSWVHYAGSPLSVEGVPGGRRPRPGSRLPDEDVSCRGRRVRLHDLTARPGVHVLLERHAPSIAGELLGPWVTAHRVDSWPGEGLVAVRPDGHVGFRCRKGDPELLAAWLDLVAAPARP